jgi:hypothetical protein
MFDILTFNRFHSQFSGFAYPGDPHGVQPVSQSFSNRLVYPGELAYGFLFFPGDEEIDSVSRIRLSFTVGESNLVVQMPLEEKDY